jgi:hypothetical protein
MKSRLIKLPHIKWILIILLSGSLNNFSLAQGWSNLSYGLAGWVHSTGIYNGELIVGGEFTWAGSVQANHIAKWNGVSWMPLGDGLNGEVDAICVYNGQLFAGGRFTASGTTPLSFIARWDGTSWIDVSGGMDSYVTSLVVYDNHLIAGGYFNFAEELPLNHIGQWNSQGWSAVGTGTGGSQGQIMTLKVWDNKIIAGGFFTTAGGTPANHIASWDGSSWASLGTGISGIVYALNIYQNNLVAGGLFTTAGGLAAHDIAMWDGSAWTAFGSGIGGGTYGYVFAVCNFGTNLVAAGIFTTAGGVSAANIAMWNGNSWSPLSTTMSSSGTVQAIFTLIEHSGELIAGGLFDGIDVISCGNIARYTDPAVYPVCYGNPAGGIVSPAVTTFCGSGSVTLSVSGYSTGVTGITLQWQSSVDGINFTDIPDQTSTVLTTPVLNSSEYYRCVVTCLSGGTSSSNIASVIIDPGPTDISAPDPATYCSTGAVLLQAPTGSGLSYRWRLNGVNISGATLSTYTASIGGDYSCRISRNGCNMISNTIVVSPAMCSVTVNMNIFIEGYYLGAGIMNASIDPVLLPNACDTLILHLADNTYPYAVLYSDTSILQTDGTITFIFPGSVSGNNCYLVVRHRNAIETWSANPVLISANTSYDFTTAINSAFGDNMADLGDGNFAIYSGDISDNALGVGYQDGVIESQDYSDMENAVSIVLFGYVVEDITGDGIVESLDYSIMENNVSFLIFAVKP